MTTYEHVSAAGINEKILVASKSAEISTSDAIRTLCISRTHFYRVAHRDQDQGATGLISSRFGAKGDGA